MTLERRHWLALSILGLALAASVTSLGNGFAYDDQAIIVGNAQAHSLAGLWHRFLEPYWPPDRGSGLYRPLTIILFALQWTVGNGTPLVFHLVNVLLYAVLALLVFQLALQLLPEQPAWAAAALFAVHPVHVEAVANGVGQAELTTALAVVAAAVLYIRWRSRAPSRPLSPGQAAGLCLLYLVACFGKEHGVVVPALLLLAELVSVEDPSPGRERLRRLAPFFIVLAFVGVGYLAVRARVLSSIPSDIQALNLQPLTAAQRGMTALALVPEWLRLLFWPAHLQADYAPLETRMMTAFEPNVALGALLLAALGTLAVRRRGEKGVILFAAGWIAIALLPVSNLLVVSGQILAERTMMLASVGAVLVISQLLRLIERPAWAPRVVVALLLAGGLAVSALRQPVWASDESLITRTAADAPRSYWAQWMYGDWLFTHGHPAEGERHMRLAVQLYPDNPYILRILAGRYQDNGFCPAAIPLYQRTLALRPAWWEVRLRLADCLLAEGREPDAVEVVRSGIALGENVKRLIEYQNQRLSARDSTRTPLPR